MTSWLDALACDRAVSQLQLTKLYGVTQAQARAAGVFSTRRSVAATKGSVPRTVSFFVADKSLLKKPTTTLRHLAGVAAVRAQLGASPGDWRSPEQSVARQLPDALWQAAGGVVAIEFDVGSYSRARILEKAWSFQGYAAQVWGSPSDKRNRLIAEVLVSQRVAARVVVAVWC